MNRLVSLITPRHWLHWPLGVVAWGLVASTLAYLVEYIFDGSVDDPFIRHVVMTSLIAAPMILAAMMLFRHLDRLQNELIRIAATDPLTGLLNRRAFFEKVETTGEGALLMLDLDHFKSINDTYGHAVGDEVLCEMARQLSQMIRRGDILGRLGGEEFAVYLSPADVVDAQNVGTRLAQGIAFEKETVNFVVTVSVGAVMRQGATALAEDLRYADHALYTAKREGRARMVFHHKKDALPTVIAS
ncbi:GGDEF domain-containing protein [Loktanella agnita]|uniref:GGDEF domain-containing protein n=1 Tax=Loktanella agnita TaxID=287097 RepID=UPI003987ECFB